MENYQVFISYKRNPHSNTAKDIYDYLTKKGYLVFLDRTGLSAGNRFPERIQTAISSSQLFILLLAKESCNSEWVKREVDIAIEKARKNKLIILPVIMDDTHQSVFSQWIGDYIFDNFSILDANKTHNINQQICNILVENQIYPSYTANEVIHQNQEIIKELPAKIQDLICDILASSDSNAEDADDTIMEKLENVYNDLPALCSPIFQDNLVTFEGQINKIHSSLADRDDVLKKWDIEGLLFFIKKQVSRIWLTKSEIISFLIKKEGYDSIHSFLIHFLHESSSVIEKAVANNAPISDIDFYGFYLLWRIIRKNSRHITVSILSREPDSKKHELIFSLDKFIDCYQKLLKSDNIIYFEHVILLQTVDLPEEAESEGANCYGHFLSQYEWLSRGEINGIVENKTISYFVKTRLNDWGNPVTNKECYGLSRCACATYDPFQEYSMVDYSIKVIAADYLFPLNQYCADLKTYLTNEDNSYQISVSINNNLTFNNLSKFPYSFVYPVCDFCDVPGITNYETAVYRKNNRKFMAGLAYLQEGNTEESICFFESLVKEGDINAMVCLANICAHLPNPDYKKSLRLYERAALQGVELCYYQTAKCYELLEDYYNALRWYKLVRTDIASEKEKINLRMGNCCYHLGLSSLEYFKDAGAKGQAAIHIYGFEKDEMYWSIDEVYPLNGVTAYCKALAPLVNEVKPRLGDFQDLHDMAQTDNGISDISNTTFQTLRKASSGDVESQFILGLIEMERFIASDYFVNHALRCIKIAANNNNPKALCFLGIYYQAYKKDYDQASQYYSKAFKNLYPHPFPDLIAIDSD